MCLRAFAVLELERMVLETGFCDHRSVVADPLSPGN
jgi:hypothetical protein